MITISVDYDDTANVGNSHETAHQVRGYSSERKRAVWDRLEQPRLAAICRGVPGSQHVAHWSGRGLRPLAKAEAACYRSGLGRTIDTEQYPEFPACFGLTDSCATQRPYREIQIPGRENELVRRPAHEILASAALTALRPVASATNVRTWASPRTKSSSPVYIRNLRMADSRSPAESRKQCSIFSEPRARMSWSTRIPICSSSIAVRRKWLVPASFVPGTPWSIGKSISPIRSSPSSVWRPIKSDKVSCSSAGGSSQRSVRA